MLGQKMLLLNMLGQTRINSSKIEDLFELSIETCGIYDVCDWACVCGVGS